MLRPPAPLREGPKNFDCSCLHPQLRQNGRRVQQSLSLAQTVEAADDGAVGLLSVAVILQPQWAHSGAEAVDRALETVEGSADRRPRR